jgi:hypothetical protein
MLISLKGTFYRYYAIDAATVTALLQANSIGFSTTPEHQRAI